MGFNKPQGRQGAAKAATGIAPLKKYISQKADSFEDLNRGVRAKNKKSTTSCGATAKKWGEIAALKILNPLKN